MGKVAFSPRGALINIVCFTLGFFFANMIVSFGQGIIEQFTQGGSPTTNLMIPIVVNGTIGLVIAIVLVLLFLLLVKKFIGAIICLALGVLVFLIVTQVFGITVPDIGTIIGGFF